MRGSQAKWQSGHAKFASSALHGTKKRRLCLPPTKIIQKVDPIVIICAVTSRKGCNPMEDTEIRYLEAHTPSNLTPKPSRVLAAGTFRFCCAKHSIFTFHIQLRTVFGRSQKAILPLDIPNRHDDHSEDSSRRVYRKILSYLRLRSQLTSAPRPIGFRLRICFRKRYFGRICCYREEWLLMHSPHPFAHHGVIYGYCMTR